MAALKLAIACTLVSCSGCCCPDRPEEVCSGWRFLDGCEQGGLLWPTGNGTSPPELRATYGQAEGKSAHDLHLGLDILGDTGDKVYALEDGVLERIDGKDFQSGLIVSSKASHGRAFLYLHVTPLDEPDALEPDDEVKANDVLGTIAWDSEPHLHLSRLEGDFENHPWDSIDELSVRNPLALLDPAHLGDADAPVIELIEEESLVIRSNEDPFSSALAYYPSVSIPRGLCDVIACVGDRDGRSAGLLAPYCLFLSVDGEVKFMLRFDGSLAGAKGRDAYSRNAPIKTIGTNESEASIFYFELTNGGSGLPSEWSAWDTVPGTRTLELCVHDVNGNEARRSMSVTVNP